MDHSASKHATAAIPGADSVGAGKSEATSPGASKPTWLREAEERLGGYRSLWESLTEEDWEFLRHYDGPEVLGPPPPPPMKRRPRPRDER